MRIAQIDLIARLAQSDKRFPLGEVHTRPTVREYAGRGGCIPFLLIEGYRIGFYSNERNEPPHVHALRAGNEAKFWLEPARLVHNYGYNQREISRLLSLISERENELLEMWHEHLG